MGSQHGHVVVGDAFGPHCCNRTNVVGGSAELLLVHRCFPLSSNARLSGPGPRARTLKLEKPRWRPRPASGAGSALTNVCSPWDHYLGGCLPLTSACFITLSSAASITFAPGAPAHL